MSLGFQFPKRKWGWRPPAKKTAETEAPGPRTRSGAVRASAAVLKRRLDRIFSEYIRLRDSDGAGICRCITCGRSFLWNAGDAGHFVSRDKLAIRFDERNVNAQCSFCNRYRSGEQYAHGLAIDRKHGKGTADLLMQLGSMRGTKLTPIWFSVKLEEYRAKLKKLKAKKKL